jgi:ATP-dependent DNA helicase RecG
MRELGEGMRRIFELMQSNELAPPDINVELSSFTLTLHHRPMYSKEEMIWLSQFDSLNLSSEEKAVVLIGRRGDLIAPNDVIRKVGIVDIEYYRQILHSLQIKGILETVVPKGTAKGKAAKLAVSVRDIPRFRVRLPREGAPAAAIKVTQAKKISKAIESGPDERNAIFVANLPPNTNDRDLVIAFNELGVVVNVQLPRAGGLSKGYAFVEFEKAEEAAKALKARVQLGSRSLVIKPKLPRRTVARRT